MLRTQKSRRPPDSILEAEESERKGTRMDIVWFAEIKWDYLKTRKQQIITRKPADTRLLFLEPYVKGRSNQYTVREEGDVLCITIPFVKAGPPGLSRQVLDRAFIRSLVDRYAYSRCKRILSQVNFDIENLGCILSNIHAIRVASRIHRRFLLYDCNDAHAAFPGMPDWSREYFKETCRRADTVFASSQTLIESISAERGSVDGIEYIGNGVEYERFQSGAEPDVTAAVDQPFRIGYLGAIAPWFDFASLELLAVRHPEWNIDLVGPVLGGAQEELDKLTAHANVTHSGAVPHDQVPAILREFTIALIPFRYGELTRGVNPNKLYEYLAVGLPVVATRFCREVQMFPDIVRAAEPGEEFVNACERTIQLLTEGSRSKIAMDAKRIAKEHDWNDIAEKFWSNVRTMMEAKHG
jgi:glycosyltransferase involved in cell wall biosynthesis